MTTGALMLRLPRISARDNKCKHASSDHKDNDGARDDEGLWTFDHEPRMRDRFSGADRSRYLRISVY
jgi:hypothetical protein